MLWQKIKIENESDKLQSGLANMLDVMEQSLHL